MNVSRAIEILEQLPPNTVLPPLQEFGDKRFRQMWCPFHSDRSVPLLVYKPHRDAIVFTCYEGCRDQQAIYSALKARHDGLGYDPFYFQIVARYTTTSERPFRRSETAVIKLDLMKWQQTGTYA